jgi:hypothetical protein
LEGEQVGLLEVQGLEDLLLFLFLLLGPPALMPAGLPALEPLVLRLLLLVVFEGVGHKEVYLSGLLSGLFYVLGLLFFSQLL